MTQGWNGSGVVYYGGGAVQSGTSGQSNVSVGSSGSAAVQGQSSNRKYAMVWDSARRVMVQV